MHRATSAIAGLCACLALAGCVARENARTGGDASSLLCDATPPAVADTVTGGLLRSDIDLADSRLITVQARDQSEYGYPTYVLAARFSSPAGESVGLLALGAGPDYLPIFPLDAAAMRATEFGRSVRPANVVAAYASFIAGTDSAAVARTCFRP